MTKTGLRGRLSNEACGRSIMRYSEVDSEVNSGQFSVEQVLNSVKRVINSVKPVLNSVKPSHTAVQTS